MVGETLRGIRARIESLAAEDGRFVVACARTGTRPVPVAQLSFPTREAAVEAADLAGRYRATLRGYDPAVPRHDLVVHDRTPGPGGPAAEPAGLAAAAGYAHDLVAAMFEALSATGRADAERAVMDDYLALAETTTDPTELCAVLLACIAGELDRSLSPSAQSEVVREAASRLGTVATTEPVADACDRLVSAGVAADARAERVRVDGWRVDLDGYALPVDERFPVLPLSVELTRRLPGAGVVVDGAARLDGGRWRVTIARTDATDCGLARLRPDRADTSPDPDAA